jgi:predicted N-formylglutamate amidohydrolase
MSRRNQIVLSCEHAANRVPAAYRHLFARSSSILSTHRGYDIGILGIARRIARTLNQPLFACCTTRLLIDPNRSLRHPDLFSQFSNALTCSEKERIIYRFHRRYRDSVIKHIQKQMKQNRRILHFSLHSFTPVLSGKKRNADMGILYDPSRKREKAFAMKLQEILSDWTKLRIRRNYPYRGNADGFTTALRRSFSEPDYLGIEIEINQGMIMGNRYKNRQIADSISLSLDQIRW